MASCVRNNLTKNYQNLTIGFQVTVKNVGDVFSETQCTAQQAMHSWKLRGYKRKPRWLGKLDRHYQTTSERQMTLLEKKLKNWWQIKQDGIHMWLNASTI